MKSEFCLGRSDGSFAPSADGRCALSRSGLEQSSRSASEGALTTWEQSPGVSFLLSTTGMENCSFPNLLCLQQIQKQAVFPLLFQLIKFNLDKDALERKLGLSSAKQPLSKPTPFLVVCL